MLTRRSWSLVGVLPTTSCAACSFTASGALSPTTILTSSFAESVDALIRGHAWVSPEVLDRYLMVSSALAGREPNGRSAFSPRESEIIGVLQRRLSDKEISSVLGISKHTVRFHLQNIFNKLAVHDRYSVIEWARTPGLAVPENAPKTCQRAPGGRRVGLQVLRKAA